MHCFGALKSLQKKHLTYLIGGYMRHHLTEFGRKKVKDFLLLKHREGNKVVNCDEGLLNWEEGVIDSLDRGHGACLEMRSWTTQSGHDEACVLPNEAYYITISGYTIRYNTLFKEWQVTHDVIGTCESFLLLEDAVDYATKG